MNIGNTDISFINFYFPLLSSQFFNSSYGGNRKKPMRHKTRKHWDKFCWRHVFAVVAWAISIVDKETNFWGKKKQLR